MSREQTAVWRRGLGAGRPPGGGRQAVTYFKLGTPHTQDPPPAWQGRTAWPRTAHMEQGQTPLVLAQSLEVPITNNPQQPMSRCRRAESMTQSPALPCSPLWLSHSPPPRLFKNKQIFYIIPALSAAAICRRIGGPQSRCPAFMPAQAHALHWEGGTCGPLFVFSPLPTSEWGGGVMYSDLCAFPACCN